MPSVSPVFALLEQIWSTIKPTTWNVTDFTGKVVPLTTHDITVGSPGSPLIINLSWTSDTSHSLKCHVKVDGSCDIIYDTTSEPNPGIHAGAATVWHGFKPTPELIVKFHLGATGSIKEIRVTGEH